MVEKFRNFQEIYIHNINVTSNNWQYLPYGSLPCTTSAIFDPLFTEEISWGEILPFREAIFFKNQGQNNDLETETKIELYFYNYIKKDIQTIGTTLNNLSSTQYGIAYNKNDDYFYFNNNNTFNIIDKTTFIQIPPFGNITGDISINNYVSAVCINVQTQNLITKFKLHDTKIHDFLKNILTLKNVNYKSFHPPKLFNYNVKELTNNTGIILKTGENFFINLTHDVCFYYRLVQNSPNTSLLILQLR